MKEDWKECIIGDICSKITSGGTPKSSNTSFYGGSIPWLNTKEVNFNRIYSTEKTISQVGYDNSSAKWIPKNSVIVAMYGATAGRVAISKIELTTNQACCNLIIDSNKADYNFIYYHLCNSYLHLSSLANGGAQQNLNANQIREYPINLPSLPTQQKIATILSSLDDKIELNNKINDNLEQQAQAIYDELFNNDDRNIILGDIIETTSGGTPSRKNMAFYTNGNYCWVKSKELQSSFIIDTEEKITDDAINNSAAKLLPKNSVLIAMYGATVGAYGIISKDMTCNQAICALLPNENYPYSYLFMFAKNITHELENLAVGSAQQNISQILIKKLKVHSDTNKIKEFHSYTHSLFEKKLLIEQENKNLSNLRDTLLPKLMSGEIEMDEVMV